MKLLYVTDLHGCTWKYDRILDIAKTGGADIVINGGDMLPTRGNLYRQGEFISDFLDSHLSSFNSAGIYYLGCPGNMDLRVFDRLFQETCDKYERAFCLAHRKIEIGGFEFIGMNFIVDCPFPLKDRCRIDMEGFVSPNQLGTAILSTPENWQDIDDWFAYARSLRTIKEELSILESPENFDKAVYVLHNPPPNLGLDKCLNGAEAGSQAIYEFLELNQPALSLHGHIHESPELSGKWFDKIGNTYCIQPGQLEDLSYVTVDLESMQIELYKEPCSE
jgi:Icc-related predicted phosphoesterase